MRIAGSVITLICGIVVLVGVFLTWLDVSVGWGLGCGISGWNFGSGEFTCLGQTSSLFGTLTSAWLVLGGGVAMAVFALPAFIVSLASKGGRAAIVTLSIFAILGALVAVGGCVWYTIDAFDMMDGLLFYAGLDSSIGYGLYISAAAAVLGFIFAILTAAFSKGRQDW